VSLILTTTSSQPSAIMTASEATNHRALCSPSSRDDLQGANNVAYGRNQLVEHHGPYFQGLVQDHRLGQTPNSLPHLIQDHRPSQTSTFPLSLAQDQRPGHTPMDASLGSAEASVHQEIDEHLHDTDAMDYGTGLSSLVLVPSTIRSIEEAIIEWRTPTSRDEYSTYYRDSQFSVGHSDSDKDSLNSSGDSSNSDSDLLSPDGDRLYSCGDISNSDSDRLDPNNDSPHSDGDNLHCCDDSLDSDENTDTSFNSLYMIIDDILLTPITPTSIELKGPGGKPLRQMVEADAYRRGECSTGNLIKSFLPGRLSPRPRYMPTVQEVADSFEAVLPTLFEEDSNNDLMEGNHPESAVTSAVCASPAEQKYQDPEEWYLPAPPGPPPDKPLPPLPVTCTQEAVRSGSVVKGKKPARLEILPMSAYDSTYTVEQGNSHLLPSPRLLPVQPAHLEPFSSSAQFYKDVLPRAVSPVYSESNIHPAFRSNSSPLSQKLASNANPFTNLFVSPSLPPSRCPSTYLRLSPESSPRPSHATMEWYSSSMRAQSPSTLRTAGGSSANTSPLFISFDLYQHLSSIGETDFANYFFTDPAYILPSPFTDPRPAPSTPSSRCRAAPTGAPASPALQHLPTRSSSLAHCQIHNAGVGLFNVQHPNTPSRTTLGRVYGAPPSGKQYVYDEARYGGNGDKASQILGLDIDPVEARRAKIFAAHQRMVDQLTGEQPLFTRESWGRKKGEMKKVSLNDWECLYG